MSQQTEPSPVARDSNAPIQTQNNMNTRDEPPYEHTITNEICEPTSQVSNSALVTETATNLTVNMNVQEDIPPPKPDFSAPPPYELATKLPSYEEVQREKTLQGEPMPQTQPQINPSGIRVPQQPSLTILAIDTDGVDGDPDNRMLGTDFMFLTAFLVAFLFNWIGFLLLMCFCHTIASRYGALSGFGLSLAKWTLIVKQSTDLASQLDNSWLWWLIMAFGLLICIRAFVQYLNIKRGWRLLSGNAQERLLFYY